MPEWESVKVDMREDDIRHYQTDTDWLEFDCVCMGQTAPEWENLPYDFTLLTLENQHFECPRCGRHYRVRVKVEVEMYTPIALKYPDVPDKMAPETLGLRSEEEEKP